MNITKKKNIFLILFFSIILILPVLDNFFSFSPIKQLFEKRLPSPYPKRPDTIFDIKNYPRNFENFYNDNYGFRKSLIWLNSHIMDNIFNESPSSQAMIGKDGWLYFDNQNSILDAQGLAQIDDKKIAVAAQSFVKNWHYLQKNDIDYLLVIAADKTMIYPEFLPDFIKVSYQNHRIDKFIIALKNIDNNFPLLDLREVMLQAKKNEIIYHQTDTHWNMRGAHYAYVEIIKKLAKNNLNLKYHPRSDFENIEAEIKGDISDIMNIEAVNIDYKLQEKFVKNYKQIDASEAEFKRFHKPLFYFNNNKNLPVLFVYKDSFFDNLIDFVSNHFSRNYYINEFPCLLDQEVIKNYQPNVVIQEFWEGRIEEVINQCK